MRLETDRLILRPFQPRDHAPLAAIGADPEVMRYFPGPHTSQETEASIARSHDGIARYGHHFVAAELKATGAMIGTIGIARIDDVTRAAIPGHPEIEIGWRLARAFWGHGLAPEGARACLDYAWTALDAPEVVAITFKLNIPSQRVMEKIGMHRDPQADFLHPKLSECSPVREHVLYRIENPSLQP